MNVSGRMKLIAEAAKKVKNTAANKAMEKQAFDMGVEAFKQGKPAAPALSKALDAYMAKHLEPFKGQAMSPESHAISMAIMTAYSRGWMKANMEAPVENVAISKLRALRTEMRTSLKAAPTKKTVESTKATKTEAKQYDAAEAMGESIALMEKYLKVAGELWSKGKMQSAFWRIGQMVEELQKMLGHMDSSVAPEADVGRQHAADLAKVLMKFSKDAGIPSGI
jgi:hypothetical protein